MALFTKKDLGSLLAEAGAGTLRRELGPLALVTLGIGAVIGAGIFVLTGTVASQNAGPALTLSMVMAGIACAFAGLCYARSEEHTSELQSRRDLVCRLLLEKKKKTKKRQIIT